MPHKSLRVIVLAALLGSGLVAIASAGPLIQKGVAGVTGPVRTFGKQVDWLGAVESTLPKTWKLEASPSVRSRAKVSWTPEEPWTEVLVKVSDALPDAVILDWTTKTIRIRPQTTAERAEWSASKLARVAQVKASLAQHRRAKKAVRHRVALPTVKRVQTAPLQQKPQIAIPAPHPLPQKPTARHIEPRSVQEDVGPAEAFYGVSVRVPLAAIAHRYGFTLKYEALDYPLPGPVTLMLQGDLPTDIHLLQRALGDAVPLSIVEYQANRLLVVHDAAYPDFEVRARVPQPKLSFFARLFGHKVHRNRSHMTVARKSHESPVPRAAAALVTGPKVAPAVPSGVTEQKDTDASVTSSSSEAKARPDRDTAKSQFALRAYGAPFGPLFEQAAKSYGYSVIFAKGVNQDQAISASMTESGVEQGLRALAARAGCVLAVDDNLHVVTVLPVGTLGDSASVEGN